LEVRENLCREAFQRSRMQPAKHFPFSLSHIVNPNPSNRFGPNGAKLSDPAHLQAERDGRVRCSKLGRFGVMAL
jgi:hypothetical protein